MFDNYLSIISATPKVAFIALIIIGAILFFEIVNLLRIKKAIEKEPEKEFKIPKPYKFFFVKKEEKIVPSASFVKPLVSLTIILLILIAATSLIIFISRQNLASILEIKPPPIFTISQTLETQNDLSPAPVSTIKKELSIKIYHLVDGEMVEVSQADLKKLKSGEKIVIVVENSNNFSRGAFSVNDILIATSSSKRTDDGNLFEEYIIPSGEDDFKITAEML